MRLMHIQTSTNSSCYIELIIITKLKGTLLSRENVSSTSYTVPNARNNLARLAAVTGGAPYIVMEMNG